MRFKKKTHRAVKRTCKTCCFKHGIKCGSWGYSEYAEDCESKVHIFWWVKEHQQDFVESRKNWLRLHPREAKERFRKRMIDDIQFRALWQ